MHGGQLADHGRDELDGVRHGGLVALALDAVEHRGVERPEAELRVAHARIAHHLAQARQQRLQPGVGLTVVRSGGQLHQLQVQVVQVADQVQRVLEVSLLLLALLAQQVDDVHVPHEEDRAARLVEVLARGDELRVDRLGAELQGPQQVLQLPQVEDVFGDVLAAFGLCDVHVLLLFDPGRGTVAVLEEVLLRLEQVARLEHHVLRLVQDRQVEHRGLGVRAGLVDARELRLDGLGNRLEEHVAQREHRLDVGEVALAQHLVDAAVDRLHVVVDVHQVLDLLLREPFVVVVDVLEGRARGVHQRLGHLVEVVDHLHVVVGRVDVVALQLLERRQQRVFAVARVVEEVVGLLDHVAQHLAVLLHHGDQRAVVDLRGALHRGADLLAQRGDDVLVGLDGGCCRAALVVLLAEVAVDEHPAAEHRDDDEGRDAAVDECQPDDEGDQESAQRRDEPSGHDGHDARDAVDGALAAPGAVGERRTHGHHEADVGGRQRQLERRGDGDEQRRGGEVDRGADHVVGGAAVLDILVFKAVGDGRAHARRNDPLDPRVDVERRADDRAREERRAVLLLPLVALCRERDFGLGDVHGLLRGPERGDHDDARGEQDHEVGRDVLVQGLHEHVRVARVAGDREGVEAGHRHADEVHQVVAREGEGQGEGAREDRDAQDVDLQPLDEEERERADDPAGEQGQQQVAVDELDEGVSVEDRLEPLEEGEVDDRGERGAAPEGSVAAERRRVAEREDQARDVHHDRAAGEGDDHREEDCRDDTHGARGVDVLAQGADAERRVVRDLVDRHGDGRAEQAEDQRDGRRGGESPRVVEVEQDDVGEHHAQVEHHDLVEGEEPRVEHAAARDLHHAARGHHADEDADGGDREDDLHGGDLGADRGVQEVDGVVRHADEEARNGEDTQDADDDGVDFAHGRCWCKF